MEKVKIITDSTADLPAELVKKYDIEVLPLYVNFGEESYLDGIEMNLHELLRRIREENIFPTTSQVNPQRFMECFKRYLDEGYKIVSLHISSKMSGTYHSACMAKEMLEAEDIVVIDSLNVTAGLGLLVSKACKLRDKGLGYREIADEIIKALPHVKSILAFESLENLVMGGRLSKTAGVIGSLLGIRPMLAVKDGEMTVIDKVRGSKKAIAAVFDYMDKVGMKQDEESFLLSVENQDIVPSLRANLVSRGLEFIDGEVGCVVGAHAGPGACGIFFIENY